MALASPSRMAWRPLRARTRTPGGGAPRAAAGRANRARQEAARARRDGLPGLKKGHLAEARAGPGPRFDASGWLPPAL